MKNYFLSTIILICDGCGKVDIKSYFDEKGNCFCECDWCGRKSRMTPTQEEKKEIQERLKKKRKIQSNKR